MGKKSKNKNKVSGAVKTAAKTEKKLVQKAKKELENLGEEDIEAVVAQLEREETERAAVLERVLPGPPEPRAYATLTAHPTNTTELIMFGGEYHDGQKTKMYNELLVYNTSSGEWRRIKAPGAPAARSAHQAVATAANKGELWIFGGEYMSPSETQFYHYRDFWKFSLTDKTWEKVESPGKPSGRSGHRMVILGKKLFVYGGYMDNGRDYRYYDDLHVFCLESRVWSKLEPGGRGPAARSGCLFLPQGNDSLLVYGGFSRTKVGKLEQATTHSDMFRLSQNSSGAWRWSEVSGGGGGGAAGRSGLSAAVAPQGKRAYVFGGVRDTEETEENLTGELSNDLRSLDLETTRWHDVQLRPAGIAAAAAAAATANKAEPEPAAHEATTPENQPVTIITDEVFTITLGGPSTATTACSVAGDIKPSRDENPGPSPRMNAMMAIQKSVLYVYGGILEKGQKQFTLSDMYSLDLHKLSGWRVLVPQSKLPEWCGSDSEESGSWESGESDSDTGSGSD